MARRSSDRDAAAAAVAATATSSAWKKDEGQRRRRGGGRPAGAAGRGGERLHQRRPSLAPPDVRAAALPAEKRATLFRADFAHAPERRTGSSTLLLRGRTPTCGETRSQDPGDNRRSSAFRAHIIVGAPAFAGLAERVVVPPRSV